MRKDLQIELKVFGLYSAAAKDIGCNSGDVDAIYSWYIDKIYTSLKNPETKQIYLKGLGTIRANPACLSNILYANIHRYMHITNFMLKIPKYHTYRKYLMMLNYYEQYKKAYEEALIKMDILLLEPIFDKPMYHKQKKRLLEFKTLKLDKLYESICRLHEASQTRSEERRQDNRGDKQQDLERIQFTKQ